ncbi:hypothetical protein QVD17_12260 [Tagetes erecta]|uniref:Uncharacterized protein n=1 Tax=Tagetes erecta TaxID=13708 RepID=A0AAD8KUP4_TARER|nr:hypothetical protein QVD17_12260 [Tagetes erecta]
MHYYGRRYRLVSQRGSRGRVVDGEDIGEGYLGFHLYKFKKAEDFKIKRRVLHQERSPIIPSKRKVYCFVAVSFRWFCFFVDQRLQLSLVVFGFEVMKFGPPSVGFVVNSAVTIRSPGLQVLHSGVKLLSLLIWLLLLLL